jgi:hypothetical protein
LTIRELIARSKFIIRDRMKMELFSRFYGSPVFRQRREKITELELRGIQDELLQKDIHSQIEAGSGRYYLKVLRMQNARPQRRFILPALLLLLTILTTTITGAMLRGKDPFLSWADFSIGLPYSFALISILLCHEMGHYIASRIYNVQVTLPYFIPLFLPAFHPGTLGAFIKMRSAIPHRKALLDIGVAGPLAGFFMSLIFLCLGFYMLPDEAGIWDYIAQIHPIDSPDTVNLILGRTLLYDGLVWLFDAQRLPMNEIYHFPFIFAGWFGLMVTAINLMPIGQLDGGHITYALFGDRARKIALAAFILLILLNVYLIYSYDSYVWVLWPILIVLFIRFRHPPTLNDMLRIESGRRILGWLAYIIFILCFSPLPFYLG